MKLTDTDEGLTTTDDLMSRFAARWAPDFPPPGPVCMLGETRMRAYRLGWGRMFSLGKADPEPGEDWGFDNGAWTAFLRGGEEFPTGEFLERLEQAVAAGEEAGNPPMVAVVPDKVNAGMESLEFSVRWRESGRLPETWPWYLAIQGGMTVEGVEGSLDVFDGVFMGGAAEGKQTARRWAKIAHEHDLPFHYGAAGTISRLTHAFRVGADSLDSVGPVKTRRALNQFLVRYEQLANQHPDYKRRG